MEALPLVTSARRIALARHGAQQYADMPYVAHLSMVVEIAVQHLTQQPLEKWADLLAAAWCHDVLQETPTTFAQLSAAIGARAATIVACVTNATGYADRTARARATYPRIAADADAVWIKLCDRLANMRFSLESRNVKKVRMYVSEYPSFNLALGGAGEDYEPHCALLWEGLHAAYERGEAMLAELDAAAAAEVAAFAALPLDALVDKAATERARACGTSDMLPRLLRTPFIGVPSSAAVARLQQLYPEARVLLEDAAAHDPAQRTVLRARSYSRNLVTVQASKADGRVVDIVYN